MFKSSYLLIIFAVIVIAFGQVAFKYAAQHIRIDQEDNLGGIIHQNALPFAAVMFALVMYMVSTLAWIVALRTTPLSIAFMFNSLSFVLVPIAGFCLFGEQAPRLFLPGLSLIIAGIVLVNIK